MNPAPSSALSAVHGLGLPVCSAYESARNLGRSTPGAASNSTSATSIPAMPSVIA